MDAGALTSLLQHMQLHEHPRKYKGTIQVFNSLVTGIMSLY